MGSVVMVVDPTTNIIAAQYEYNAFGNRTQVMGTEQQPYGYTGREYDAESGLYHYRARAYDPKLGLFIQSHAIGFKCCFISKIIRDFLGGNNASSWKV